MSAPLKHVLMRQPADSLRNADPSHWNFNHLFDPDKAIHQHKKLANLLRDHGIGISWIEDQNDGLADAMFTRDASIVTKFGAILFNMGKEIRRGEPNTHATAYDKLGIPILGRITGSGRIEGGDLIWLDHHTLVVGLGFRSNREGVRQLNEMLNPYEIQALGFDLPVWTGENDCLHLMSYISPLSDKFYIAYTPLMPTAFYMLLKERGITIINSPEKDFHQSYGQNVNVLPINPTECIMIDGFPDTKAAIEATGIKVHTFSGDALCMACEGGPTCLTNIIYRETEI